MFNSKFIKIIIALAIIFMVIFAFLFIRKNNTATDTSANGNSTSTLTGANGRPILNTNLSNTNSVGGDIPVNNDTNVDPADYNNNGPEDVLKKNIEKILFNWNITKDQNSLRQAVGLTENTDNEVVPEAWIPFMKTDSSELVKLINTSTDIKKTKTTIKGIFEWYIELSGEYDKLPPAKKQQITSQYNQLK